MAAGEGEDGKKDEADGLMEVGGTKAREVKEEELEGRRGIDTYPALLLSSSQPLDWPVLGWALLSHWGRATQNHTPKERGRKREVDGGGKEKETREERKQTEKNKSKGSVKITGEVINRKRKRKGVNT